MRRARWTCLLTILAAIVCGCISPLDPDTPRRRIVSDDTTSTDSTMHTWIPARLTVTVTNNGVVWQYDVDTSFAEVDTTGGKSAVRFRYAGTLLPPYIPGLKMLYAFTIAADSMAADGGARTLDGDPRTGPGALFQMAQGVDSNTVTLMETIIVNSPAIGTAQLSLSRIQGVNRIGGTFDAAILSERVAMNVVVVVDW